MKHIRIEHKILVSAVIFTVFLAIGATAKTEDEPEIQDILFFESSIGEVVFPHEAHFDALEIECQTCHHEHDAANLDLPHPEYFEDFWIKCGTCHHEIETPQVAQSCATCHHCPTDCADETLSVKVVIHKSCWQCHEGGTGLGASETCILCHSGPKAEW